MLNLSHAAHHSFLYMEQYNVLMFFMLVIFHFRAAARFFMEAYNVCWRFINGTKCPGFMSALRYIWGASLDSWHGCLALLYIVCRSSWIEVQPVAIDVLQRSLCLLICACPLWQMVDRLMCVCVCVCPNSVITVCFALYESSERRAFRRWWCSHAIFFSVCSCSGRCFLSNMCMFCLCCKFHLLGRRVRQVFFSWAAMHK